MKHRTLLRRASKHCPPGLKSEIESALGPQPDETLGSDVLWQCMIDAIDARDRDDALHYAERLSLSLNTTP